MTIPELYQNFILGKELPTIGTRTARALLDVCRDKLLSAGRAISGKGDTKAQLLEARRLLVPGPAVYCSATSPETEYSIEQAEQLLAMLQKHNATPRKSPTKPTATKPTMSLPSKPATAPAPAAIVKPPARPAPSAHARDIAAAILDEQAARDAAALLRTRAQLDTMKPAAISKFFKAGGKLIG